MLFFHHFLRKALNSISPTCWSQGLSLAGSHSWEGVVCSLLITEEMSQGSRSHHSFQLYSLELQFTPFENLFALAFCGTAFLSCGRNDAFKCYHLLSTYSSGFQYIKPALFLKTESLYHFDNQKEQVVCSLKRQNFNLPHCVHKQSPNSGTPLPVPIFLPLLPKLL